MQLKECKKGSQALNEVGKLREEVAELRMELIGLRGVVIMQGRRLGMLEGSTIDEHEKLLERVGMCD